MAKQTGCGYSSRFFEGEKAETTSANYSNTPITIW